MVSLREYVSGQTVTPRVLFMAPDVKQLLAHCCQLLEAETMLLSSDALVSYQYNARRYFLHIRFKA